MSKNKFDKYWALVQGTAARQGRVFFMDSGEGREHETEDMKMEDISGWLIPIELSDEFKSIWIKEGNTHSNLPDKFDDTFRFALWSVDDSGKIEVEFKDYGFWGEN